MTVVAFDGKTMAADSHVNFEYVGASVQKVFRIKGDLVGWAGGSANAAAMIAWLEQGAKPSKYPEEVVDDEENDVILMRVNAEGVWLTYTPKRAWVRIADRQMAIGTGGGIAIGAMACGKTAIEAVEIACLRGKGCSRPVQWLDL